MSSPIWSSWPDIYYCLTVTVLFLWGARSDERTGLSFVYPAGPCQSSLCRSESLGTWDHILLSQIWDFPFRRLLRLAGSRWRYSTPPPHGPTYCSQPTLYSRSTAAYETILLLTQTAQKTRHVISMSSVRWCADCCLATRYRYSSYSCNSLNWRLCTGLCLETLWPSTLQYIECNEKLDLKMAHICRNN
jgi:hypothetical protein